MCCLFGLLDYSHRLSLKQRQTIIRALSIACEDRGTDATGIAYFTDNRLYIQKAPRAAHSMRLHIHQDARYIMGHTRMTTQGDERKNYNNHPFSGKAGKLTFAMAHNGVIHNDKSLQLANHLPATKIETDSYVAVQLIEQAKALDFNSLCAMAEALRGSFTITVLNARNNLYIVKGNNPLCLYHFPEAGFLSVRLDKGDSGQGRQMASLGAVGASGDQNKLWRHSSHYFIRLTETGLFS